MCKKPYAKITITGDPGSGKSTVSRYLSKRLGFEVYYTGKIQREVAEKLGMATLELNIYSETHPEIDEHIDSAIIKLKDKEKSLIIDSRLAWYFIPDSFKVYFTVDIETASKRILNDQKRINEDIDNLEQIKRDLNNRKRSESERFKKEYQIDISNVDNYDLIIETSHLNLDEITEIIINTLHSWLEDEEYNRFITYNKVVSC